MIDSVTVRFPHMKQDVHHSQIISVPTENLFLLFFDLEHKHCFLPVDNLLPKMTNINNNKNLISTQLTESPPCACFSVGLNPAFKIHSHSVWLRQTLQCVKAFWSQQNHSEGVVRRKDSCYKWENIKSVGREPGYLDSQSVDPINRYCRVHFVYQLLLWTFSKKGDEGW